jgi:hypothetical protein
MKRTWIIILIITVLSAGCRYRKPTTERDIDCTPSITPDYLNVTIPYNIAPLNFKVDEAGDKMFVSVKGRDHSFNFVFKRNKVIFPEKKWAGLLKECQGDSIEIRVGIQKKDTLKNYKPFKIFVSPDPIDGYLVYRQIMPGFQNWNQMGIYQRSLSSFRVSTIMDSKILPGTCMNCHTFPMNDPSTMVLHLRESYGGTILYRNNKIEKLNTKSGKMFGAAAFPYWHPSKKYIAFSVNMVNQIFHATGPSRAAALDMKSDIDKNEMLTSPALSASESFETFPCFSTDGMTLFYCSARAVKMPENFDKTRYSLCSVSFNPETGKIGDVADTIISGPALNKSISIPRTSPDGRFLMFTMADYGAFPSYNPEADLYMLDLESGKYESLNLMNSTNVESWHSWSSNGRWVVFSSRRGDGLYSNPYIAFIDKDGRPAKPFLLPQKDPSFYSTFLFSYNVPELVKTKVLIDPYKIEKIVKRTPGIQVVNESGH